ncbi:MAG: tRNA pseudouridine synthase A [Candidatus Lokiarchaeia archaeon]|nr:tRNA pseudouridine synthase A [Candidatus Lokiarchaeia archaeon]
MLNSKFLFKIYYIGTNEYFGSQRQPSLMTIEESILNALISKGYIRNIEKSKFEFASRTDRYVSARGACFTCITEREPILMEINTALPKEIGIWAYSEVPVEFISRFGAILRHYVYIVPYPISYFKKTSGIDINLMKKACKDLEGNHDFANFSKKEDDKIVTIRDMDSVSLSIYDDYIVFQFKSRAFLRQQVRRMVKKVLELGINEISYNEFLNLFDVSKNVSYQPADPQGLILWDIKFNENIDFIVDPKSKERMDNYFIKKKLDYNLKYHLFRALQQNDFS